MPDSCAPRALRRCLASIASFTCVFFIVAQPLDAQRTAKSGAKNGTYPNQKLKTGEKSIRSVALLPPTVIRHGCSAMGLIPGPEDESVEARSEASDLVATALRQRGWNLDGALLSSEALKSDDRLRTLVDYLRSRSGNLAEEILNRPDDTKSGRYTLGGEVAGLGLAGRADALVVVRSASFASKWCSNDRLLYMDLIFADPQSGEVLGFSTLARHSITKLTTEKRVQEILKELKKIP